MQMGRNSRPTGFPSNDRCQVFCDLALTKFDSSKNWFYIPETAVRIRDSLSRMDALFAEVAAADSDNELSSLRKAMADKNFDQPNPRGNADDTSSCHSRSLAAAGVNHERSDH